MKLNNNGWGYKIFILCLCMISSFVLIANYYIVLLIGAISK